MSDTKTRILQAAEQIMLEKGYNGVGLNEVLAAVKVPKGSFYHYFPSKEQFGVEMLKHYVSTANAAKRRMLLSTTPEPDPVLRLNAFMDGTIARACESGGKCCCLALKLTSEVTSMSDDMRKVLADGSDETVGIFRELLDECLRAGKLRKDLDTQVGAEFVWDLWTGAMFRAQVMRSVEPFRAAAGVIRNYLGI